jgi:hypothetical protein
MFYFFIILVVVVVYFLFFGKYLLDVFKLYIDKYEQFKKSQLENQLKIKVSFQEKLEKKLKQQRDNEIDLRKIAEENILRKQESLKKEKADLDKLLEENKKKLIEQSTTFFDNFKLKKQIDKDIVTVRCENGITFYLKIIFNTDVFLNKSNILSSQFELYSKYRHTKVKVSSNLKQDICDAINNGVYEVTATLNDF